MKLQAAPIATRSPGVHAPLSFGEKLPPKRRKTIQSEPPSREPALPVATPGKSKGARLLRAALMGLILSLVPLGGYRLFSSEKEETHWALQGFKRNTLTPQKIAARKQLEKQLFENQRPNSIQELAEYAKPAVVAISRLQDPLYFGNVTGTGYICDEEGIILTNFHVAGLTTKDLKVRVTLFDGRSVIGEVVYLDEIEDLAAISIKPQDLGLQELPALKTYGPPNKDRLYSQPPIGTPLVTIGHPNQNLYCTILGTVADTDRPTDYGLDKIMLHLKDTFLLNANLTGGASGSPVLDTSGHVVGMNAAGAGSVHVCIPAAKQYLAKLEARIRVIERKQRDLLQQNKTPQK